MRLSLIAAMASNRVIGRDNALPWRLPPDLKHFKRLTLGHCVIMGRKTFESMGKPLAGRTNIVITRNHEYWPEGVKIAHTVQGALALARGEEVFIIGGAEIYRQTLPVADRLYLTLIEKDFDGDTRFPEYPESEWELVSEERGQHADLSYRFLVYDRKDID